MSLGNRELVRCLVAHFSRHLVHGAIISFKQGPGMPTNTITLYGCMRVEHCDLSAVGKLASHFELSISGRNFACRSQCISLVLYDY